MLGLSQRQGPARQTVPVLLSLLALATTVVAQPPEGEPNGNEPPAPDCSRCNDNIDLVCTADGRVYPNLCVAACTGRVSPMDIVNCAEDLIVEVSAVRPSHHLFSYDARSEHHTLSKRRLGVPPPPASLATPDHSMGIVKEMPGGVANCWTGIGGISTPAS